MSKLIVLKLDRRTDAFWIGFLKDVEDKTVHEYPTIVIATVGIKSYSLADHQFIEATIKAAKREVVVLIPRNIVLSVVQGKTGLDAGVYFSAGSHMSTS